MCIGQLFADDDIKSENGIGKEYAKVPYQFRMLFHRHKNTKNPAIADGIVENILSYFENYCFTILSA